MTIKNPDLADFAAMELQNKIGIGQFYTSDWKSENFGFIQAINKHHFSGAVVCIICGK